MYYSLQMSPVELYKYCKWLRVTSWEIIMPSANNNICPSPEDRQSLENIKISSRHRLFSKPQIFVEEIIILHDATRNSYFSFFIHLASNHLN